jgi:hypothetical protein
MESGCEIHDSKDLRFACADAVENVRNVGKRPTTQGALLIESTEIDTEAPLATGLSRKQDLAIKSGISSLLNDFKLKHRFDLTFDFLVHFT